MMQFTTHPVTISVNDNILDITPSKLEVKQGDEISFNYTGKKDAILVFIGGTPLEKDSYILNPSKDTATKITAAEAKSFGYVVSTNPAGGGTIIIKP